MSQASNAPGLASCLIVGSKVPSSLDQVPFQTAIFCAISMNTGEGRHINAIKPAADDAPPPRGLAAVGIRPRAGCIRSELLLILVANSLKVGTSPVPESR